MKFYPIFYFTITILFISILLSLPLFNSISNLTSKLESSSKQIYSLQATPDYWPTSNWKFTSPESQGMSSGKLGEMENYLQNQPLGLSFL